MSEFVDPYLDPQIGLLRNLVGASSKPDLDEAEAALSFVRSLELYERGIDPSRDLTEICAIHWHLFQDVYPWAGLVRTVDIRKPQVGAKPFLPVSFIERAAEFAFQELAQENGLKAMDRDSFIARLAYHYDQLNYIHPFREGNGRVQRAFWDRVAEDAGWSLDWTPVAGAVNDRASRIAVERHDLGPLIEMLDQIVKPLTWEL